MAPVAEQLMLMSENILETSPNFTFNGNSGTGKLNEGDAQGPSLVKKYDVWEDDWSK